MIMFHFFIEPLVLFAAASIARRSEGRSLAHAIGGIVGAGPPHFESKPKLQERLNVDFGVAFKPCLYVASRAAEPFKTRIQPWADVEFVLYLLGDPQSRRTLVRFERELRESRAVRQCEAGAERQHNKGHCKTRSS
jgi:hypothetical protein